MITERHPVSIRMTRTITAIQAGSRKFQGALLVTLILLTFLLYLPGVNGPFLHDDFGRIVDNELVTAKSLDLQTLLLSTREYPSRPLSMISFAVNHASCGAEPVCFKLPNLLLHLLTGLALFIFLRALGTLGQQRHLFEMPGWLPLAVTALWLLHPLQVSTVLYAVQRMTQLATLFSLLALFAWLRARSLNSGGVARILWLLATALFSALAILSKESAYLIPLYILLLEWLLYRKSISGNATPQPHASRPVLTGALMTTALAGIFWWIATFPPERILAGYLTRDFQPMERLLTETRLLMHYASLLFYPTQERMIFNLDNVELSRSLLQPLSTLTATLGCLALIGWSFVTLLRKPSLIAFGILFFFVGHLIESTVIGLVLAYEHRNYLPAAGLLLATVALLQQLQGWPRTLFAVTLTVLAIFSIFNLHERVNVWSSEETYVAALESPRWINSYGANADIARHTAKLERRHSDDPMLVRLYHKKISKHLALAARATSQPFLPLAQLLVRPASPAEHAQHWDILDAVATNAPLNVDALNATAWLGDCLLNATCLLPHARYAHYLDLLLANPRQDARTRALLSRVAGTFFTKVYGDTEKGIALARQGAASGLPEARESLIKNLAFLGRLDEAGAEYAALRRDTTVPLPRRLRIEAALAHPGVVLPPPMP